MHGVHQSKFNRSMHLRSLLFNVNGNDFNLEK